MKKVILMIAAALFMSYGLSGQLLTKDEAKKLKKEHGKGVRRFGNSRTGGIQTFISKKPATLNSLAGKGNVAFKFKVTNEVEEIEILISIKGDYQTNASFQGITVRVGSKKNTIKEVNVPLNLLTNLNVSYTTLIDMNGNAEKWTTYAIPLNGEYGEKIIDALFKSNGEKLRIFIEYGVQFNPAAIACRGFTLKELDRLKNIIKFREVIAEHIKNR